MVRSRKAKLRQGHREDRTEDLYGRLVTVLEPTSTAAEAYRTLRTNLLYGLVDAPPKIIVLTSPGPREGKSTTCANLSVLLAQADKNVLLMDCDFRKPVMHKIFRLRNLWGVTNVIVGERGLRDVWQEPLPGLKVLTAGPIPPNPADLLGSKRFTEFLDQMRQVFDFVVIDTPPIELVSDPAVIASQSDGVLLVLDSQDTSKASLRNSIRNLEAVGANILGTIVNNVGSSGKGSYKEEYKYSYGY